MDGFDRSVAIVILAATNRPEILDPALLRAGRFDRQVLVDRPDKKGRVEILRIHMKKLKLAAGREAGRHRRADPGLHRRRSGQSRRTRPRCWRRGAARRRSRWRISPARWSGSWPGWRRSSRILIPRERRIVAYHEMGHALVALAIPGSDPVQKVSIIPRGIGGARLHDAAPDRGPLPDEPAGTGGQDGGPAGRARGGNPAGRRRVHRRRRRSCQGDRYRPRHGDAVRHGRRLGPVAWDTEQGNFMQQPGVFWRQRRYSETTANEIDLAVRDDLDGALARAIGILRENRAALDEGADRPAGARDAERRRNPPAQTGAGGGGGVGLLLSPGRRGAAPRSSKASRSSPARR